MMADWEGRRHDKSISKAPGFVLTLSAVCHLSDCLCIFVCVCLSSLCLCLFLSLILCVCVCVWVSVCLSVIYLSVSILSSLYWTELIRSQVVLWPCPSSPSQLQDGPTECLPLGMYAGQTKFYGMELLSTWKPTKKKKRNFLCYLGTEGSLSPFGTPVMHAAITLNAAYFTRLPPNAAPLQVLKGEILSKPPLDCLLQCYISPICPPTAGPVIPTPLPQITLQIKLMDWS